MKRAVDGEQGALDDVLARYQERLLVRIRLMMGVRARHCAESVDFLQEVLLEVVQRFDAVNVYDERRFLRWMLTIARSKIVDEIRRRREDAFQSFSESGVQPFGHELESPSLALAYSERAHRLLEALDQLDEEDRRIIELRHLEGLTWSDIGSELDRSERTARYAANRALLRLGHIVRRQGIDEPP